MNEPRRPWERPKDRYFGLTAMQFNLTIFVAGIAAVCVWLFGFGGVETVGLRNSGDGDAATAVQATATPSASASATPAPLGFQSAPCMFEAPPAQNVACGYLTVPESRVRGTGRTVRLPVAIFNTSSNDPEPDPIVFLAGGPGQDLLESVPDTFDLWVAPLLAERDVILLDQRGAGFSEPSLDCPELNELDYDLLERQFTVDEAVAQSVAAATQCHDRLVNLGIDPSIASSAESAADLNDLRLALGYEQWNLYGVSYGTKLALTVMRDYPEGLRSVILDSTYPLQVNLYAEDPADFGRALRALFDSCAADAFCRAAYPGIESAFYETVRRLNERPVMVTLGAITGRPVEGALIDGDSFAAFVFQSLYSEDIIPLLPKAIFDTLAGDYIVLTVLADFYIASSEAISIGMHYSVQCGEEMSFTSLETALAAGAAYPELASYYEQSAKSTFAVCEAWDAYRAAAVENEAVKSDIPTLVLAGQFDPITPPDWGRLVASDLSRSFFFEFSGRAHGVAFAGDCPRAITDAFLANPERQPASGCIARMSGPEFVVGE